ncbi:hypothetical protein ACTNE0_12310 [Bacillota bacterium HCP3S3_E9]
MNTMNDTRENTSTNEHRNYQSDAERIMKTTGDFVQNAFNLTDCMQRSDNDLASAKEFAASDGYDQTLLDIQDSAMTVGQKAAARSEADKRQTENLVTALDGITKYHNEMHGIKMDNIKAGLEIAKCVGVAVIAAYAITTFVPQFMSKN